VRFLLPSLLLALSTCFACPDPALAGVAEFVTLSTRCAQRGAAHDCRSALDQSHQLKNWAEGIKLWRCYTAVLGAESRMIADSFHPGLQSTLPESHLELRQLCGL